ncbi:MAG TPA: hypothetical protein VGS96_08985 [Thermoanaerobaculia bacterium]|nr:hypothetical protein [Thermoanaerobaculia bacterium]
MRELLRHTLATLAYRGAKAIRDAPAEFASFKISPASRAPKEILAHIGDLLGWGRSMADGTRQWNNSTPLPWPEEVDRFFRRLSEFESYLASDAQLQSPVEKLFQGPIADALTHVGQLTMLRRAFGAPIRGENYFKADISVGRVGEEQAKPRFEFD